MTSDELQEKCLSDGKLIMGVKPLTNFAYIIAIISFLFSFLFLFGLFVSFSTSSENFTIRVNDQEVDSMFVYFFICVCYFIVSLLPLYALKYYLLEMQDTIVVDNEGIKREGVNCNLKWLRNTELFVIKWSDIIRINIDYNEVVTVKNLEGKEFKIYMHGKLLYQDWVWVIQHFGKKTIATTAQIELCKKIKTIPAYIGDSIKIIIVAPMLDIFLIWAIVFEMF